MKIIVTVKEIMDKGYWDDFCDIKGWNPWCVSEGLCSSDEKIELSRNEAQKFNFIPKDNNNDWW